MLNTYVHLITGPEARYVYTVLGQRPSTLVTARAFGPSLLVRGRRPLTVTCCRAVRPYNVKFVR